MAISTKMKLIGLIVVLGLLCGLIYLYLIGEVILMDGKGMIPTLAPKAICILDEKAFQKSNDVKRFDIILFKNYFRGSTICTIRRVIGLPNETITIDREQGLTINYGKTKIDNECANFFYQVKPYDEYRGFQIHILREDEFFVLGDNVSNQWDSRYFGTIHFTNILGRVKKLRDRKKTLSLGKQREGIVGVGPENSK